MKALVISVSTASGISKKTGNAYQIRRARVLVPLEEVSTQNYQLYGAGYDVVELPISDQAFPTVETAFKTRFKGAPVELDLVTGINRRAEAEIQGIESDKAQVASPLPNRAA